MENAEIVDVKTGEVVESTPENLLLAARDAAQALERVIELNDKPPVMFSGKRYLEIHHWQTIGKFYNCSVRISDAEPCEIQGIQGFKAKADLLNDRTGAIVGGSVAYCMRDEPNWKTKPIYALASMAQTRAGSKALSNKFRFVAIIAGYEGLSLEEVPDELKKNEGAIAMPRSRAVAPGVPEAKHLPAESDKGNPVSAGQTGTPLAGPRPLTTEEEAKLKAPTSKFFAKLHAVAREKKISSEAMKRAIKELFKKESSKDLVDGEMAMLIKAIENGSIK